MKVDILGVKIDSLSKSECLEIIERLIKQKKHAQIVTVNPEFVMTAQKDEKFRRIINRADLAVADGIGLLVAAQYLGRLIQERITGVELTWTISRLAAEKKYRVFFLGGEKGIAEKAAKKIKSQYPNLKIVGTYAGRPNDPATLYFIKRSKPDILFVAFGAPKQDKFIDDLKKIISIPLSIGVGGTFDYIAGVVPYAPGLLRKIGLEWLYRLITQPRRFNRIFTATVCFPWAVFWAKFRK